jgi:sigma-B regulation protein RsbU (phosphoserine phosphatase)
MADLQNDFEDFFEQAICGYLLVDTNGIITRANNRIAVWMDTPAHELAGKRFSDLLSIGGRIYYETHLWPLLRMQGFFDEVALELALKNKERMQVLANAYERRNENGIPLFVRVTVFKATDRRLYEQTLRHQKTIAESKLFDEQAVSALREQFIAVLGHDLRNPLSSIMAGASLLSMFTQNEQERKIIGTMNNSARRMGEMIEHIMDFARGRLGSGMTINLQSIEIVPLLQHVADEISAAFPGRTIETSFNFIMPVDCDAPRVAQLLSNLLANALTHGSQDRPVYVEAFDKDDIFELSVSNSGNPIPAALLGKIFHPFTREQSRPSQNGLGLGLYIASQVAIAHGGELTVRSDEQETRFTFRMPARATQ